VPEGAQLRQWRVEDPSALRVSVGPTAGRPRPPDADSASEMRRHTEPLTGLMPTRRSEEVRLAGSVVLSQRYGLAAGRTPLAVRKIWRSPASSLARSASRRVAKAPRCLGPQTPPPPPRARPP